MSNPMNHAALELKMTGHVNDLLAQNVLALMKVFADQGHSGMSASFTRGHFVSLVSRPLADITQEFETYAAAQRSSAPVSDDDVPQPADDPIDQYANDIVDSVEALIKVFLAQHHDDASAAETIATFKLLANFKPLGPLTGTDDEWHDISVEMGHQPAGTQWQNKRCSRVFKDGDVAYDMEGRIFREPDGNCFTSKDSWVYITFPYVPVTEYVDVPADR